MKPTELNSKQIRAIFLDFFKDKKHKIVSSAPVVVKNDPTLMFTNAGMNQFKDYFLGTQKAPFTRAADTQKCLRVSGKHNDLEEVGVDTYHHTLFEMLGNWSFGDYFKQDAIAWAWELLVDVYQIPKDRLYVTVFEGDASEQLPFDQESYDEWKKHISEDRILKGNKKDNFWEMGETGPCGPCSEIHVDIRSDEERIKTDGKTLVNASHPQVIEIWNNVFMEFNRKADGCLEKLPQQHVDTGMGFERLCMVLQGKQSNYDTDVFQNTISFISEKSGIKYGVNEKTDIAMRVMSDHIRAIVFTIADGQLPSNNKAGYVIRRILRRAVRYAYTFLKFKQPFLYKMVNILADQFADIFPEVSQQKEFIAKVIYEEESSFLRTLETGLRKFDSFKGNSISGKDAFELYDTYGFPIDLTQLMAREKNMQIDMNEFHTCMEEQKNRSRKAGSSESSDWEIVREEDESVFIGYDEVECISRIIRYRSVQAKNKKQFQIVLDRTPFYAESGGQVGDTGTISSGSTVLNVLNTIKENNLTLHLCDRLPENPEVEFKASIDRSRRNKISRNHSVTHLMHSALRSVLGSHVAQKGSLVDEHHTRFDFSHFNKVSNDEIIAIEKMVNEKIRENISLEEMRGVPIQDAMNMGATALFGEKYGETVRVIVFDKEYSIELCGGTHVKQTAEIGMFKIKAESSVAAGVRRIEGICGESVMSFVNEKLEQLDQLKNALGSPDPLKAIEVLKTENEEYKQKISSLYREKIYHLKSDLVTQAEKINGVHFIAKEIELNDADSVKSLSFDLKNTLQPLALLLGTEINGNAHLSLILSDELTQNNKVHAGKLIKELSKEINGGGGGQAFYATAGGSNVKGIASALQKFRTNLQDELNK
ncbi:MAG TPA: alanine--tRNA ligase [Bacteroidia bacterium]|nr:alanine--tRNA ligase [Bacteroidia bacterium]